MQYRVVLELKDIILQGFFGAITSREAACKTLTDTNRPQINVDSFLSVSY